MSITTYEDAPRPLTDNERRLLKRIFSDFFEVPGEWKTALKAELEKDPPVLGKQTLGTATLPIPENAITSINVLDGSLAAVDMGIAYKDGAATVPSMRTLGTGALQAAAGNDARFNPTFLSGSGAPTSALGTNGAIYLDYTNKAFYGPKAAGTWPATPFGHLAP